jgi:endonuclease III
MFDKLKDTMRIMTAPVQSHKPLQLDEIVDATLQELKRQLAKAESALAASQQELARSDKARLFDKLKADNLQAMAEHFAERNTALESALAASQAEVARKNAGMHEVILELTMPVSDYGRSASIRKVIKMLAELKEGK